MPRHIDYPDAVEDTARREPEWQPVELGYGQFPTNLIIDWDPIHNKVRSEGPKVLIHYPDRPK